MVSEEQRKALERRLLAVDRDILDSNNRQRAKRLPARCFMLFLLIGGERETAELLRLKVQGLLSNPKACDFLYLSGEEQQPLGRQTEQIIHNAAESHVDVENLNEVFLCPVLFAGNARGDGFLRQLDDVQRSMDLMGKTVVWQPVLVIGSRIEQYPGIYRGFQLMAQFITGQKPGTVHRCCVLSDLNENGHGVPLENNLETIAVCTVLENTQPDNPEVSQVINRKVRLAADDKELGRLFFTARSVSVSIPVRSIIYQRMISAINFFSGDTDKQSGSALQRMKFGFIAELLEPYMKKLPHVDGHISFFPLYGVMDGKDFQARMQRQIDWYYWAPLYGKQARDALLPAARQRFFQSFFSNNGSLGELEKMLDEGTFEQSCGKHRHECFCNCDIEPPLGRDGIRPSGTGGGKERPKSHSALRPFQEGEYAQARRKSEDLIRNAGVRLLEELVRQIGEEATRRRIEEVRERLDAMREVLQERQKNLRDVEVVLSLGQNERLTDFGAVQDNWFESIAQGDEKLKGLNRQFDEMVCQMLLQDVPDFSQMLLVCYEAVKDRVETNRNYLKTLSDECTEHDNAQRHASAVEKGWCYTLRFLKDPGESDITCLIGDKSNRFCQTLAERFKSIKDAKAPVFEFKDLDKLGVLHVSAPFRMTDLRAWNGIEEQWKQTSEVEA